MSCLLGAGIGALIRDGGVSANRQEMLFPGMI